MQWLTARRMERASERLVHSGERISTVAHLVGFSDEHYLTRRLLPRYSTALTISSTTFLASPKTIMVLSM